MRPILAALLVLVTGTQPAASSISGRVTDAASGVPLPRILVTLVASNPARSIETLTDGEGRFVYRNVAPGSYAVSAASGEYRSTYLRQWFGEPEPTSPWSSAKRYPVEITAGSSRRDVDIALMRALAIEGRVVAPLDEGMANVPVYASRPDGRPGPPNAAFTDDLGNYRVYGLAPGRYRLCADARARSSDQDTAAATFVRTCHPSAIAERDGADVIVTTADVAGIDIHVQRTGGRTISGTVVDAAGLPAEGARIFATSVEESGRRANAVVRDGAFVMHGLLPGAYTVLGAIGGARPGDPNPAARELEIGFSNVDVGAVDAPGVGIALSRAAKLPGRLVLDGPPISASAVARIVVRAHPVDPRVVAFAEPQSFTVLRGDLTFDVPDIYNLPLLIRLQNLPDGWALKGVRYRGRDVTYAPTDFASAPARVEVSVTNRLARPIVRVADTNRGGVSNVRVLACPVTAPAAVRPHAVVEGRPSPDGVVRLEGVVPGEYFFVALTSEDVNLLFMDKTRFDTLASIATRITVHEGEGPSIELRVVALPEKR